MMIPSATPYTKVSSFAIISREQDLKTLFLVVSLCYCGLREQTLVFNPTGYWWLLVAYTKTIINSVVSLPTGLKLESILHSSGWWMMTDFSKQVLWYTTLSLESGLGTWLSDPIQGRLLSIYSYHLCFCILIRLFEGLTSLGFSSLNTTVYLRSEFCTLFQ